MQVGTPGCEFRQVGRGDLALGAGEGSSNGCHAIETQYCDQVERRRPARRRDRSLCHGVFPQARKLLGERNVGLGIIFVEGGGIGRSLIEHNEVGQGASPFLSSISQCWSYSTRHYSASFMASAR